MKKRTKRDQNLLGPVERIERSILLIRGQRVMLDANLATLYGVETKQLKRAVRRNINRFPKDFMFQLTEDEFGKLRSRFGTSSWGGPHRARPIPYAGRNMRPVLGGRQE